jgi:hypothetical protein
VLHKFSGRRNICTNEVGVKNFSSINITRGKSVGLIPVSHKSLVRTSQRRLTKTNPLIICREVLAAYCRNHSEQKNTLAGQNAVFNVKLIGSAL